MHPHAGPRNDDAVHSPKLPSPNIQSEPSGSWKMLKSSSGMAQSGSKPAAMKLARLDSTEVIDVSLLDWPLALPAAHTRTPSMHCPVDPGKPLCGILKALSCTIGRELTGSAAFKHLVHEDTI